MWGSGFRLLLGVLERRTLSALYLGCLGGSFYLEAVLSLFFSGVGSRDVWCGWCYGGAMAKTSSMASSSRYFDALPDLSLSSRLHDLCQPRGSVDGALFGLYSGF